MPNTSLHALITGGSSGFGEHYARQLAQAGHSLTLVARRVDKLEALAAELRSSAGIRVDVLPADLSTKEGVASVVRRIEDGPRVDLFINNAGYAVRGRVDKLDADALDEMIEVNITAMSRLARAAFGQMIPAGAGAIINVSSATAFLLIPGNAGYGATKSYVMAFTRHMQLEAAGTGVHVQLLVPGVVATDFHHNAGTELSSFPPERVMRVEDLVAASLQALSMREEICIPSMPEVSDWASYLAAEQAIAKNVSWATPATRYQLPDTRTTQEATRA